MKQVHQTKLTFKEKEESFTNQRSQRGRGRGRGRVRRTHYKTFINGERGQKYPTRGRGRGSFTRRDRSQRYDKSQVEYYNCHKLGHYASDCRNTTRQVEEKAQYVEEKMQENLTLLFVYKEEEEEEEEDIDTWYLQMKENNHMYGSINIFLDLDDIGN